MNFSIIFLSVFFIGTYYFIYKKYIFSLLDPLLFFVLIIGFSSVLILKMNPSGMDILYFFLSQLFFYLGFSRIRFSLNNSPEISFSNYEQSYLETVLFFLFIIYLIANVYAGYKVGFALLNNDPTFAKSAIYLQGLGFIRRINWGLSLFLSCGSLVMIFLNRKKFFFLFVLLIQIAFTLLNGSKGGLLLFGYSIIYMIYRPGFLNQNIRHYLKYSKYIFSLAFIVAIIILYKENNNSLLGAVNGLFERLLKSGDIILYYYQTHINNAFEAYNYLDYFFHEFNSILGIFKIVEYQKPLGYEMLIMHLNKTGESIPPVPVGPNTLFFVEGNIYFGFVGGLIYSFIIGYLISFIRMKFFTAKIHIVYFIFLFTLTIMVFNLAIESSLFVSQVFDTILFVLPIIIFIGFLANFLRKDVKAEKPT